MGLDFNERTKKYEFTFSSRMVLGKKSNKIFTTEEIKNEPMLFNCDFDSALEMGGPLTNEFLGSLDVEFISAEDLIIDSRVHMLFPDFYPCIPGWHHDDVPRELPSGQPNYYNPSYHAKHAMFLVNGDIAPTAFALGKSIFQDVEPDEIYYKVWHDVVESQLKMGELKFQSAPSNQVVYFDWQTWHKGIKAVKDGWRFFIRASINTGRKPTNELRKQVQVYLSDPHQGW